MGCLVIPYYKHKNFILNKYGHTILRLSENLRVKKMFLGMNDRYWISRPHLTVWENIVGKSLKINEERRLIGEKSVIMRIAKHKTK